jgi:hypothetical protein
VNEARAKESATESVPAAGEVVLASPSSSLESLELAGDIAGLLSLARAHRVGTGGVRKDLMAVYRAYEAAARLGSAEATFGQALFLIAGTAVPQDVKTGMLALRTAADAGYTQARVYLGNAFETGFVAALDAEKAEVWYRAAGRSAGLDPKDAEYPLQLAALGCGRYVDEAPQSELKEAWGRKAKALGYTKGRAGTPAVDASSAASAAAALALTAAPSQPPIGEELPFADDGPQAAPSPRKRAPAVAVSDEPVPASDHEMRALRKGRAQDGLVAFGYGLLFAAAGAGGAYAAVHAAKVYLLTHAALPGFGHRVDLLAASVMLLVGLLPQFIFYRGRTVLRAALFAAAAGAAGWFSWGLGKFALFADRPLQAWAFAVAGFLASAFVLGLVGGAKRKPTAADAKL